MEENINKLIAIIFIVVSTLGITLQIRKDRKDYYEHFRTKN